MTTNSSTRTTIIKHNSIETVTYTANGPDIISQKISQSDINVYVNSAKLPTQTQIAPIDGYFIVYIDGPCGEYNVSVIIGSDTVIYTADSQKMFEEYDKIDNMMDDDTSFMLLRANPKLTGNVKVVVEQDGKMYLDTFKVSKGLSQKKYRRIPINPDEYYGRTLMAKFRNMPINDFYKIEDSCYDLFSPGNNLDEQYYDKYNCGVRTNDDKIYSENFSILAPLCIRKKLPDFFLVFKVNDYENNIQISDIESENSDENTKAGNNRESHEKTLTTSVKDLSFFLDFDHCEIVKCFDMRDGTDLGKYLRNIVDHNSSFVGDIFAAEDDEHMNIFQGISVERGIVTKYYESHYDFADITNQVAMNNYYTGGFERNHLVSKDILNLEFMFDDPSEELFSINHYYGLYVRLNGESSTFSCVEVTENNIFDTQNIHGSGFEPNLYKELIYGITTPYGFERLSDNIFNSEAVSKYKLTPHTNIATVESEDITNYMDGMHAFASVQLNDVMEVGEHYRVIDRESGKIYEVIASNAYDENDLSPISYDSSVYNGIEYTIMRISILNTQYRKTVDQDQVEEIKGRQVNLIAKAFNLFDTGGKLTAFSNDRDVFSIVIKKTNEDTKTIFFIFEKVLAICGYNTRLKQRIDIRDKSNPDYYSDNSSSIFGIEDIGRVILDPNTVSTSMYFPHGFESMGNRLANVVYFVGIPDKNYSQYPILIDSDITDIVNNYKTVIYKLRYPLEDRSYTPINRNIAVTYQNSQNTVYDTISVSKQYYTILGFGSKKMYYMVFPNEPQIYLNDKIQLYQNFPINAGICSIFQIKDLYYDVIDSQNNFILSSGTDYDEGNISKKAGEYQTGGIVPSISLYTEENFTNYVDTLNTYLPSYDYKLQSDSELGVYLKNLKNSNHMSMDVAVTVPNCCKWKVVGTDCNGNRMRLMYNLQDSSADFGNAWRPILDQNHDSYWIPKDSSTHIGLLSARNNVIPDNKYIKNYNSFDDYTSFNESLHFGKSSIEDLIFYNTNQEDRFSKIYEYGDNAIEFISGGVKIRAKSSDKSKLNLNDYSGYSAILVGMDGTNPRRPSTFEFFIDETKEQIAIFAFNGIDSSSLRISGNITDREYFTVKHYTGANHGTQIENNTYYFIDDGNLADTMWDSSNGEFTSDVYDGCQVFMVSNPPLNSFADESYAVLSGTMSSFIKIDDDYYFVLDNVTAFKNGVLTDVASASNSMGTVTMYIVVNNSTEANACNVRKSSLSLEEMKTLSKNYSIFIKKGEESIEYDDSDQILKIDFVSPFFSEKQKDSSIYKTQGYIHPSYEIPVTENILPLSCIDSKIDTISGQFSRCFNAANIMFDPKVKNLENIRQTWLRKVIDLDAIMNSTNYRDIIISVEYDITVPNIDNVPIVNRWYTDLYNSKFYLKNISHTGDANITYVLDIEPYELIAPESIVESHVWTANKTSTGRPKAVIDGSYCDASLSPVTNGYYNGSITVPESATNHIQINVGDKFYMKCPIIWVTVDTNATSQLALNEIIYAGNDTKFFICDNSGNKISLFGDTLANAPVYDFYDETTHVLYLRLRVDPPTQEQVNETYPDYIINTIHPIEPVSKATTSSGWKIRFDEEKIQYQTSKPSESVYFTVNTITRKTSYPSVTLTYEGETPQTEMPEVYPAGSLTHNKIGSIDVYGRTKRQIDGTDETKFNTTGLTLFRELNPLIPYWYTNICRLFNKADNYISYYGAYSGYEKNMFLASRGITLKSSDQNGNTVSSITIKKWFGTKIDDKSNSITLDITESVFELIKNTNGYSNAWARLDALLSGNSEIKTEYNLFKGKYINNTILKFIIINEKTPFNLYIANSSTSFGFNSTGPLNDFSYVEIENMSTQLSHKNGKYYITIKNLEPKQYYATMKIKLLEE